MYVRRMATYTTHIRIQYIREGGGEGATRVRKHACTRDAFDSNILNRKKCAHEENDKGPRYDPLKPPAPKTLRYK